MDIVCCVQGHSWRHVDKCSGQEVSSIGWYFWDQPLYRNTQETNLLLLSQFDGGREIVEVLVEFLILQLSPLPETLGSMYT